MNKASKVIPLSDQLDRLAAMGLKVSADFKALLARLDRKVSKDSPLSDLKEFRVSKVRLARYPRNTLQPPITGSKTTTTLQISGIEKSKT